MCRIKSVLLSLLTAIILVPGARRRRAPGKTLPSKLIEVWIRAWIVTASRPALV